MPSTLRTLQACALALAAAGALTQGFLLPSSASSSPKATATRGPLQASTLEPPTTVPAGVGGEGIVRPAGSGRRWGGWRLGCGLWGLGGCMGGWEGDGRVDVYVCIYV